MEHYYFIQQNGTKKGPFKLSEIKELIIYFDELVWRSDSDQWKKASELEELIDILIVKPPPTPKEKKINQLNKKFVSQTIWWLMFSYIITSLLIGFISYGIAQSSWGKYLQKTGDKYLNNFQDSSEDEGRPPLISQEELNAILNDPKINGYDKLKAMSDASDFRKKNDGLISYQELIDNKRYPFYFKGQNNESNYGNGQGFWFRPFKAFVSTVYLTEDEQNNSNLLLLHLFLSSFASLSFVFIIIGIIFYVIKRTNVKDKLSNKVSKE